jgi:multidrug efflux pump subunit AcrB
MRLLLVLLALAACRDRARPAESPPVLAVRFEVPGADPETIEGTVVVPVEHALAKLAGVRAIEARIDRERATVHLEVAPAELDRLAHELTHALGALQPTLPPEAGWPVITKTRKHDAPVLWLAVRGTLPIALLSRRARDEVKPALARVPGVAAVEEHGLAEEVVTVTLDLAQLAARDVTVAEIAERLPRAGDVAKLAGTVIVRDVRLGDVATVELAVVRDPARDPMLAIRARHDANRDDVVRAVRRALAAVPAEVMLVEVASPVPTHPPAPLVVELRGPDHAVLRQTATRLFARLAGEGIRDVMCDPGLPEPDVAIVPDRDAAVQLGVSLPQLAQTLRVLLGARHGAIAVKHSERDVDAAIERAEVRTAGGARVPLAKLVRVSYEPRGPILRRDRERAIELAVYPPAAKLDAARAIARELALPDGHRAIVTP